MAQIINPFEIDRNTLIRSEKIKRFLDENKNVRYNTGSKFLLYSNKLADNPQSISAMIEAFNKKNGYTLLTAPTGAGKTFLIDKVFSLYNNKTCGKKAFLNILITPNRIQNIQNGNLYQLIPVVGKSKSFFQYNLMENNSFSVVSDKAGELVQYISKLPKECHINLCLDEAHDLLMEAFDYREKTTNYIYDLIQIVRKRNGSVVAMTATPESLLGENFNNFIFFRPEMPYKMADNLKFVQYTGKAQFWKGLSSYLKKKVEEGYIPFVRYNDIKMTERICDELSRNNIISLCVDSSQKQSVRTYTGFEMQTGDYYLNPMVEEITKRAALPQTIKMNGQDEKIQIYFTTSMVEVGTNICSVSGEQNRKLLPVFVCQNNRNVKMSSIVQFMNRIRYNVEECAVFISKEYPDAEKPFLAHEEKIEQNFKKATVLGSIYINHMKSLQDFFVNRKTVDQIIKHNLLFDDVNDMDGLENIYKCLSYDNWNRRIMINKTTLRKISFDDFMKQYYYYQDIFVKDISRELNIPATIIGWGDYENNSHEPDKKNNTKLEMFERIAESEVLQRTAEKYHGIIKESDKFHKDPVVDFSSSLYTPEESKEVKNVAVAMNSREGNHFKELISGGMDTKEAAKVIATGDEKEYKKAADSIVKESFIPTLNKVEKQALESYLLRETTLMQIGKKLGTAVVEKINRICNSGFKKRIVKALSFDLSIDIALRMVTESKNYHDMDRKLKKYQCRFLNYQFKCRNMEYFIGAAAREQYVILMNLVQYNANGNLVQKTLTTDVLQYLASALNQTNGHFRKKLYGVKEVLKLCKDIFWLRNVNGQYRIIEMA